MTFTLRIREHIRNPAAKRHYNECLFNEVAPKYDFITGALSLGRDRAWKRRLIDSLPLLTSPVCVDLACGTGDVSFLLAGNYPGGKIIGADLTPAMIERANAHNTFPNVEFIQRDMCATGLADASVDIVTGSYALRNAPDLRDALREVRRVLKPGGTAAFLDFSKPRNRFGQALTHALLKTWGGFWGLLLHGTPEVYAYIAESLKEYPDRAALRDLLAAEGFTTIRSTKFYFGIVELLIFSAH